MRYRFSDDSDAPSSIDTSTDGGTTRSAARYVTVPGLGIVESVTNNLMTFQLTNLQGDVVATQTYQASVFTINSYNESDEYGNSLDVRLTRYGWLGQYQRSTDAAGGAVLMGSRVYNPGNGLFLTVDPVPGGNVTAYTYPQDPINSFDPGGDARLNYGRKTHWTGVFTRMDYAWATITLSRSESLKIIRMIKRGETVVGALYAMMGVSKKTNKFLSWWVNAINLSLVLFLSGYIYGVEKLGLCLQAYSQQIKYRTIWQNPLAADAAVDNAPAGRLSSC